MMKPSALRIVSIILAILLLTSGILFTRKTQKPAPKPTPTPTASVPLRLAFPSVGTVITGQIGTILERTDILKQHGFSPVITPMNTGKEMKVAIAGGQVDAILTSESNFVVLLGQGFKGYAVASLGTDGNMGLVVRTDSPIKTIAQLKGKKVGTLFGTSVHRPTVQWLQDAGLTPGKNVEVMNFNGADALRVALESRNVDAILTWDPYLMDGINKKTHRPLKEAELDLVVVMSAAYADSHPEAVANLRSALAGALWYLSQHKPEANAWYADLSKLEPTLIDQASAHNRGYTASSAAEISVDIGDGLVQKFKDQAAFLFQQKLIDTQPDVEPSVKR